MKATSICVLFFTSWICCADANAASFDCRQATTRVEKAICGDAALGRLDEEIGRQYRDLMGKLEPRYQTRLLESQKDWLKSRGHAYRLQDAMRERLDDLRNALVTVNSVTLLRINGNHMPPYVLTPLPGAAAYDREVDAIWSVARSDNDADAPMEECSRIWDGGGADSPSPAISKKLEACESLTSTSRGYVVDFVSPDLLSVEEQLSEYGWHVAHPSNSRRHLNWWLSKAGKVEPKDIFVSDAYRHTLAMAVHSYLKKAGGAARAADTGADNPERWGLTPAHLRITGEGYDYGIGRGDVEIEIPWSEFKAVLRPQFLNRLKMGSGLVDRTAR